MILISKHHAPVTKHCTDNKDKMDPPWTLITISVIANFESHAPNPLTLLKLIDYGSGKTNRQIFHCNLRWLQRQGRLIVKEFRLRQAKSDYFHQDKFKTTEAQLCSYRSNKAVLNLFAKDGFWRKCDSMGRHCLRASKDKKGKQRKKNGVDAVNSANKANWIKSRNVRSITWTLTSCQQLDLFIRVRELGVYLICQKILSCLLHQSLAEKKDQKTESQKVFKRSEGNNMLTTSNLPVL